MNDRELLELAARAAGMNIQRSRLDDPLHRDFLMNGEGVRNPGQCSFPWNPLTDDGDALRLAVQLDITIGPEHPDVVGKSLCRASWSNRNMSLGEFGDGDKPSAYRRAIVRAAAEIGKSMGGGE
ncbi:TPA: hypothetical protein SH495_005525 [Pseudomonas aeruginosa]|nr:hypothetical protein [Pseudomonas aeruginosa]HEH8501047.1 hypothetical protein [Pseudomonas aeruginosa]HEH8694712.1 hypothetical protein [Pseudomonas aeruginosa]HEH8705078.1 hypothetical protein [Pseudomonas aeruginosa]HEH8743319.1 hypothetical protein [Pseudomonas aeruginosa]